MKSSKRIKFLLALAQATTAPATTITVSDLSDSSILFTTSKSIWIDVFPLIKLIANILNKSIINITGNRTSLERIKQDTSVINTLASGSPQIVLNLCKQFVESILEKPAQTSAAEKKASVEKFKSSYDSNLSLIKDISPNDKVKITDTLNQIIAKLP